MFFKKKYSRVNLPLSLDEALSAKEELIQAKSRIESDLSTKKPIGRVDNNEWEEYLQWKKKTVPYKSLIERQLSFLKGWIRENSSGSNGNYSKTQALFEELVLVFQRPEFAEHEKVKLAVQRFFQFCKNLSFEQAHLNPNMKDLVKKLLCNGYQVFHEYEENNCTLSPYQLKVKNRLIELIFFTLIQWDLKKGDWVRV